MKLLEKLRKTSFNSQRDGILQLRSLFSRSLADVSIPNGMEFYTPQDRPLDKSLRFNSQRDGILRYADDNKEAFYDRFNSQRDGILRKR